MKEEYDGRKENGLVSICIPTYNNILTLKRLLKSIKEQTYSKYEVIITDDSTIDIYSEIEQFLKGPNFLYFKNPKSLGATSNANSAIAHAKGEFIKVMHHDDFFSEASSLEKMVSLLSSSNADICFTGTWQVEESRKFSRNISIQDVKALEKDIYFLYNKNCIGAPSATIWRNKQYTFDENLKWLVDVDLYIRVLKNNPQFVYTLEPIISIGVSNCQLTNECQNNQKLILFEYEYLFKKFELYNSLSAHQKMAEVIWENAERPWNCRKKDKLQYKQFICQMIPSYYRKVKRKIKALYETKYYIM